MYRLFGIFAILTLLCISSTSGHDINYQFTSISVAEGLSQSTAQSILLDKKGKLWIGTKNGLNFYTGQNLKIFKKATPNDRYSLPSNHIIHLTQDSLLTTYGYLPDKVWLDMMRHTGILFPSIMISSILPYA